MFNFENKIKIPKPNKVKLRVTTATHVGGRGYS